MGPTSRIVEEADLSDASARKILGLLEQSFPSRGESQAAQFYRNGIVPSWRVLIESPMLIGHLAVVDRWVRIGSTTPRVAGIHGVCVSSDRRGGGIGSELISSAMSEAFERNYEIAMLFTRKPEVYVSAGFRTLEGSVSRALPARIGRRVPSWMGGRRRIGVEKCGVIRFERVGQTCMWRPLRRLRIPRGASRRRAIDLVMTVPSGSPLDPPVAPTSRSESFPRDAGEEVQRERDDHDA